MSFLADTEVVCSRKLTYLDLAWGEVRIELKLMLFEPKLEVLAESVRDTNRH